jgi:outer membrane biosynthesis protein TonB
MDEDCVILDLPEGLRLNLLGLIVEIERILITADRAGLLGGLLASLTCGGVESADRLEALAQMIRSQQQGGDQQPAPEEEEAEPEEEEAEPEEEEPELEEEEPEPEEEEPEPDEEPPPKPRRRRSR